jgi:DNA-binding NarL/FixJ family response regulator
MTANKPIDIDKVISAMSIQVVSLEGLTSDGFEPSDNGWESENQINDGILLTFLTKRQRSVAVLLNDGYTRKETAGELAVSLQAIHQIVLRMRKRLRERAQVMK